MNRKCLALLCIFSSTVFCHANAQNQAKSGPNETGSQEQPTPELPPTVIPPVIVSARGAGPVQWILPGPRRLSQEVFGTPERPLGWQEKVGVPVNKRLQTDDGSAWTTTAFPTLFSDRFETVDGEISFTVTDVTALDGETTNDKVELAAKFSSPAQEGGALHYRLLVKSVIPSGPTHSFFGGVGTNAFLHGSTGIGSMLEPRQFGYAFCWGVGELYVNGDLVAGAQLVHMMMTQRVRTPVEEGYKLVFTNQVDELKGMGRQIHLILPPKRVTARGLEHRPVPTGYVLSNGKQQPFIHIMFDTVNELAGSLAASPETVSAIQ